MNSKNKFLTIATTGLTMLLLSGCGSDSKSNYYASTVAPTTSSTTTPTTSTVTPVTSTVTPGTVTPPLLTDAMVSSFTLDEVIEVDAQAGTISNRWATGDGPTDVVNFGAYSYVANSIDQNITQIDRLANNTSGTIDVTTAPITGAALVDTLLDQISFNGTDTLRDYLKLLVRPTGMGVTPSGDKVVCANLLNVTVCDVATMTPQKSFLGFNNALTLTNLISNPSQAFSTFFAAPIRGLGMAKVACTDDKALVTCMITGTVMRIDLNTNTMIDYVDVGNAPIGITMAAGKTYVACAWDQEVWVLDDNGNVLSQLSAGMIPVDVTSSPSGDKVYVANAFSGDISVIDTAVDQVIDTLPAGMSLTSIFNQLGVQLPAGTTGGWQGALNGFLQGYTSGLNNTSSFGALLTGVSSGSTSSLLSPANLINGALTAFLAAAGVNQTQLANLNMPGVGIMSLSVTENPDFVCAGNALLGELAVTEESSKSVNSITGLTGLGPVDVDAIMP